MANIGGAQSRVFIIRIVDLAKSDFFLAHFGLRSPRSKRPTLFTTTDMNQAKRFLSERDAKIFLRFAFIEEFLRPSQEVEIQEVAS